MFAHEKDITEAIKKLHSVSLNPLIKDVNSSEYFVLKKIIGLKNNSKDGKVYVSSISKILKISTPSVTKLLNSLEKKELIIREIDSENRRNTLVEITEKGNFVKKQNDSHIADLMTKVYQRVGRENIIQFLHLSDLIFDALDDEIKKFILEKEKVDEKQ